jgi:membrane-associated phospholipid phosphatase
MFFFYFDKRILLYIHRHISGTIVHDISSNISMAAYNVFYKLGMAVSFVLIIVFYFRSPRPKWTVYLIHICLSISIAIIIGDGFKYFFGRCRPIMLFNYGDYGITFFGHEWALNSTPSGHTLRAFALFTSLSLLFRRFMPLFITFAVLIGLSRIAVTAHYPSDVLFGAYIGIFCALWTYRFLFHGSRITSN